MSLINLKYWRLIGAAATTFGVIATAVACTKTTTPTTTAAEAVTTAQAPTLSTSERAKIELETLFSNFQVAAGSNHSQLLWAKVPELSSELKALYQAPTFSVRNYLSDELAANSANEQWSANLPQQTSINFLQRYLWVRIVPLVASSDAQTMVLNLTTSSKLANVKVLTSAIEGITLLTLLQVQLLGSPLMPTIINNISPALQPYVKIQWKIDQDWIDEEAFLDLLKSRPDRFTRDFIDSLIVRTYSIDESKYIVDVIEGKPNVDQLAVFVPPVVNVSFNVPDLVNIEAPDLVLETK